MTRRRLVLFDIDGTLVDVRGAGRRAFADALREAAAIEDALHDVKFAGATDLSVLADVARKHERDVDAASFFAAMAKALVRRLGEESPRAVDGAVALVDELARGGEFVMGLVTGNARVCAHVKLDAAKIPKHFVVGAYGDEHADRDELARRARSRAELDGAFDEVFLIGDTPNDVAAARACGAVAIGVARGDDEERALVQAGAAHVVRRLDDARVLAALRRA